MRRTVSIFVLIPLGVAAFWSIRLARADAAFRAGSVSDAIRLIPNNTAYIAQAALEADVDGRDSVPFLQEIVALNPTSAAARIRLGLAAEAEGDVAGAEKWLLAAFGADRQFETRWSLANFYFRQDRSREFWNWVRSSLEISYGDLRPVFDLCWRMSDDGVLIQPAIPESARDAYLRYILDTQRLDAVPAAAEGIRDRDLLGGAARMLLEAHRSEQALVVWATTGDALPSWLSPLRDARSSSPFEWQFDNAEGAMRVGGRRLRFSGKQAEVVRLMSQYAAGLQTGKRYKIESIFENAPEGLEWHVDGQPAPDGFVAHDATALVELWYVRPRGSVRAEGTFEIRDVKLSALQ